MSVSDTTVAWQDDNTNLLWNMDIQLPQSLPLPATKRSASEWVQKFRSRYLRSDLPQLNYMFVPC